MMDTNLCAFDTAVIDVAGGCGQVCPRFFTPPPGHTAHHALHGLAVLRSHHSLKSFREAANIQAA